MADNTKEAQSNGRSILITGASEGAGLALLRELVRRGHKVTGTTTSSEGAARIRRVGGLPANIQLDKTGEVQGILQATQVEIVVHLAASYINEVPQHQADVAPAIAALEATDEIVIAAGRAGVKRIILGSFAFLYGDAHGEVDESAPISREIALFQSAAHAETAVLDGGIPGYVVRSGYSYGGNSTALRALENALVRGYSVPEGKHVTAWVHEDDLAAALVLLVEQPAEGEALANIFNVADDTPASPDQFIEEFGNAVGTGKPDTLLPFLAPFRTTATQRALLATSVRMNTSKIRALGWKPHYPNRTNGFDRALSQWRAEAAGDETPVILPERAIVAL
jgi:nucleoside-diphosphate-sugar epimerase